jgi:hypothetical protein
MNVVVEEESGHFVMGFTQDSHRVNGAIGAADVQKNIHGRP